MQSKSEEPLILATLCSIININKTRLDIILAIYPSLSEAVADDFFVLKSFVEGAKEDQTKIVTKKAIPNPKIENHLFAKEFSSEIDTNFGSIMEADNNVKVNILITTLRAKDIKFLEKWKNKDSFQVIKNQLKNNLERYKINFVTILETSYPKEAFLSLSDLPPVLYYQGSIEALLDKDIITVVGSREITEYTQKAMNKILIPCARMGLGLVSGLALGVDEYAHKIAVENQAKTIAIIGSGIDDTTFYPKLNLRLKHQILENKRNLVLSEYPPFYPASRYTFPTRNRLLAAVTELTMIAQASPNSGSLITAIEAKKMNKIIATIPGSILEESYCGNNQLIKEGAKAITEPIDLLKLLGKNFLETPNSGENTDINQKSNIQVKFDNEIEKIIYENLALTPQSIEILSDKLNLSIAEISISLSMLEIQNFAQNIGENRWIKKSS